MRYLKSRFHFKLQLNNNDNIFSILKKLNRFVGIKLK